MARTPIHPGEILADELVAELGMSTSEVARILRVPPLSSHWAIYRHIGVKRRGG